MSEVPAGRGQVLSNGEVAAGWDRVQSRVQELVTENEDWQRRWNDPQALRQRLHDLEVEAHAAGALLIAGLGLGAVVSAQLGWAAGLLHHLVSQGAATTPWWS